MPLEYRAGCLKILIIMKPVKIKITLIYIQINNRATTTMKHFKAVKCKEYKERNRLTGKVLLKKTEYWSCRFFFFFFYRKPFLPKSDYVIANGSDIFSALVYMDIHYL